MIPSINADLVVCSYSRWNLYWIRSSTEVWRCWNRRNSSCPRSSSKLAKSFLWTGQWLWVSIDRSVILGQSLTLSRPRVAWQTLAVHINMRWSPYFFFGKRSGHSRTDWGASDLRGSQNGWFRALVSLNHSWLFWFRCRLRKKNWRNPGTIYSDNQVYDEDITLTPNWEMLLEVLDGELVWRRIKLFGCGTGSNNVKTMFLPPVRI